MLDDFVIDMVELSVRLPSQEAILRGKLVPTLALEAAVKVMQKSS